MYPWRSQYFPGWRISGQTAALPSGMQQDTLLLSQPLLHGYIWGLFSPESLHTLIDSGDVYIRANQPLQEIPEVDVVCYGLWVEPSLAKNHGVFVSSRKSPDTLDFMLQKPSLETLGELAGSHLFLMDIGIWLHDRTLIPN